MLPHGILLPPMHDGVALQNVNLDIFAHYSRYEYGVLRSHRITAAAEQQRRSQQEVRLSLVVTCGHLWTLFWRGPRHDPPFLLGPGSV